MSILNTASDGFYNVLIALCRALIVEGPLDREKLIDICSGKNDKMRIRQTLLRWTQLGLFVEDNGQLSFCPRIVELTKGKNRLDKLNSHVPLVIRETIFSDENNEHFWDSERSNAADITRALSWVLSQDIYNFSLDDLKKAQEVEAKQLTEPDKRMIQNDVRLNGLRFWARYLGFTWQSKEILIDPTGAITQEMPVIFSKKKRYLITEFLDSLAARVPVLDGGKYRKQVEAVLDPQHWQLPPTKGMLSTSLSRALWRMELAGIIDLEQRADAPATCFLQRQGGETLKTITHVLYRG